MRRPLRLARRGLRNATTTRSPAAVRAIPAHPTITRAIALLGVCRNKFLLAAKTWPLGAFDAVSPPAVRIECRGAVRTDHSQILDSMVVPDAVDVIQDHRHWPLPPNLTLSAQLTLRFLQTSREEPTLDVLATVGGVCDQDLRQGPRLALQIEASGRLGIKVLRGDLPLLRVFLENAPSTTRRAEAQLAQAFCPRLRSGNRSPGLLLRVA